MNLPSLLEGDRQGYKTGPYQLYLSMWQTYVDANLVHGRDFTCGARFSADLEDVVIGWQLPEVVSSSGIYGYLHVSVGNYNHSGPLVPLTPKRVSAISKLETYLEHRVLGDPGTALLHETYLTATAHATGELTDMQQEIGWFPHVTAPVIAFMNAGTQRGTFVDPSGRSWTVAEHPTNPQGVPYIMLRPTDGADVQGVIHWDAALSWLVAQGRISGNSYFNGLASGVEPYKGDGALWQRLRYAYA